MRRLFLLPSAFVLLFNACASNGGNNIREETIDKKTGELTATVEAEGIVGITDNDIPDAKKRALADAQKNAVEMAVGVYVNATTRVEKTILVEQHILSKTNGYIKKYKILSENKEGNFYKTRIQAAVKIEEINKDLVNIGLNTPPPPSILRIAVMIQDKIDGLDNAEGISENILAEKLLSSNYKVIDINSVKSFKTDELIDNIGQQGRVAELLKADIIIVGKALSVFYTDQIQGRFISYNANISFKAIKINQSALLHSNSFSIGGLGITKEMAARESLKRAARLASGDLVKVLQERLKTYDYITLIVKNVSTINELNAIMKGFQKMDEAKSTKMGNFSDGVADIKIETKLENVSLIVGKIESAIKGVNLKVVSVSNDSIETEIQNP